MNTYGEGRFGRGIARDGFGGRFNEGDAPSFGAKAALLSSPAATASLLQPALPDVTRPVHSTPTQTVMPQPNGSATSVVNVAATGDARIDGLLAGTKWAGAITYADTDSASDYQSGYFSDGNFNGVSAQNEGFSQFNAQQMKALHSALGSSLINQESSASIGFSVSSFTNLSITYAGAGNANATIRVANSNDPGTAYAYYPDSSIYGGDSFFGNTYDAEIFSLKTPVAGGYAWYTYLHEMGHSLGLKHSQELDGPANVSVPFDFDNSEFTVMSYRSYAGAPIDYIHFGVWGAPQTYMMLDIAALQTLYGADYTVNSGDTTYSWNPGSGNTVVNGEVAIAPGANVIFATIWDGGGIDTYDLSSYTTNLAIDLTPGGSSLFKASQAADLGDGHTARGNIYNALTFGGSNASLIENAIGGSGNDTILGNDANNTLNGGAGNDTLNGGTGLDTASYAGATTSVVVSLATEAAQNTIGAGSDTLISIENLIGSSFGDVLTGRNSGSVLNGAGGDDAVIGGDGADAIFGGDGNDRLLGGAGDDVFDGGAGSDTVSGNAGNDTYRLLDGWFGGVGEAFFGGAGLDTLDISGLTGSNTTVTNLADGTFAVFGAPAISYLDFASTENFTGNAGVDTVTGSGEVNILSGRGGDDRLFGLAANDILEGGDGNDLLDGGDGSDTASYASAGSAVTVSLAVYAAQATGGAGTDTLIFIENLTGSTFADTLTGDGNANVIDGGAGGDAMGGGAGNDTYYVDNTADNVIEGATGGAGDLIYSSVTYSLAGRFVESLILTGTAAISAFGNSQANALLGNSGANTLAGFDGADSLDGGAGADRMDGGNGDDVYYVDNALDNVIETSLTGGTNDRVFASVSYALTGREIEGLILTGTGDINGTGNASAQSITGNSGANILTGLQGNDQLFGLGGVDTLDGGADDDTLDGGDDIDTATYASAAAGVTVSLAIAGAQNTVGAGSDTLIGIENLTGSALGDTLTGDGGANVINGGAGADIITGGLGADTLIGGDGNDYYYVDNAGDIVTEGVAGGTNDTVESSVSFSLAGRFVETVLLTGSANSFAIGNSQANTLTGNTGNNALAGDAGADVLDGKGGADTLAGGTGADFFVFSSPLGAGNIDKINDFVVVDDTIRLASATFTGLVGGVLDINAFFIGAAAADANDRIIYNSGTGALLFDADGNGAGAAVQFATLSASLALTNADFIVV